VQGEVSPDAWTVRRDDLSITSYRPSHQTRAAVLDPHEGLTSAKVPSTRRRAAKLSTSEVSDVAKLALAVERREGYDGVDIEWAIDDDGLWLLQARPITT
jgi:pyruvate,water dikinase